MKHLFILFLIMNTTGTKAQTVKAETTRNTFNRFTEVSINISADAASIWKVLTNAQEYTSWNSTITSMEGNIALGEKIKLKSTLDEKRTFKLKVKEMEENKTMVWGDGKGKRTYTLEPQSDGTTNFSMHEKIGGLMFPMYAKMIPSFDESFEQFAKDLKTKCESK